VANATALMDRRRGGGTASRADRMVDCLAEAGCDARGCMGDIVPSSRQRAVECCESRSCSFYSIQPLNEAAHEVPPRLSSALGTTRSALSTSTRIPADAASPSRSISEITSCPVSPGHKQIVTAHLTIEIAGCRNGAWLSDDAPL
jgi:hypothetical protein